MKISELIQLLEAAKAEHGDMEIRYMQMPISRVFQTTYEPNWIRIQ